MDPYDTRYHRPIDLESVRETRKVRAGRATPDFTFADTLPKQRTTDRIEDEPTPRARPVFWWAVGAAIALGAFALFTH